MALKGASQDFGSLHAQIDPIVLDGRDRGLRNSRPVGELVLAQFLELADNSDGFTYTDFDRPLGLPEFTARHWLSSSVSPVP